MDKIALVGFPQATIANDILWLMQTAGHAVEILHPDNFLSNQFNDSTKFIIVVTKDMSLREQCTTKLDNNNLSRASFINNTSIVDPGADIGVGSVILQFSSVGYQSKLGKDCFMAPYTMLSHKSTVGQGTVMLPGTIVSGSTSVGKFCVFGLKSSTIDGLSVCDHVELAAGDMLTKNIEQAGWYVGSPARRRDPLISS